MFSCHHLLVTSLFVSLFVYFLRRRKNRARGQRKKKVTLRGSWEDAGERQFGFARASSGNETKYGVGRIFLPWKISPACCCRCRSLSAINRIGLPMRGKKLLRQKSSEMPSTANHNVQPYGTKDADDGPVKKGREKVGNCWKSSR